MTSILHVSSSSNPQNSVTRQIGSVMVDTLIQSHPGAKVITRDVVSTPLPHLTPGVIGAMFGGPDSPALALSDSLVEELLSSDVIVIEAPMYNFGIPSALKAWIDHIVRVGKTFQYTATGPKGMIEGKKAIIILSSGGIYSEGPAKAMDFQETYLRAVLGFIGITDVEAITIAGTSMGPEKAEQSMEDAKARAGTIMQKAA